MEQLEQLEKRWKHGLPGASLSQDVESTQQSNELTTALIDRLVEQVEISHYKQIKVKFRFHSEFQEYGEVPAPSKAM